MSTLTLQKKTLCTAALKGAPWNDPQTHKCFTSGVQKEVLNGVLWSTFSNNDIKEMVL